MRSPADHAERALLGVLLAVPARTHEVRPYRDEPNASPHLIGLGRHPLFRLRDIAADGSTTATWERVTSHAAVSSKA